MLVGVFVKVKEGVTVGEYDGVEEGLDVGVGDAVGVIVGVKMVISTSSEWGPSSP